MAGIVRYAALTPYSQVDIGLIVLMAGIVRYAALTPYSQADIGLMVHLLNTNMAGIVRYTLTLNWLDMY